MKNGVSLRKKGCSTCSDKDGNEGIAPRYFVSRPKPKTPSDLSEHVCLRIVSNPPQDEWSLIDAKGNMETIHVSGNFEADDSRVLADAMFAGLGIGIRPEKELAAAVEAGTLCVSCRVIALPAWRSMP